MNMYSHDEPGVALSNEAWSVVITSPLPAGGVISTVGPALVLIGPDEMKLTALGDIGGDRRGDGDLPAVDDDVRSGRAPRRNR